MGRKGGVRGDGVVRGGVRGDGVALWFLTGFVFIIITFPFSFKKNLVFKENLDTLWITS